MGWNEEPINNASSLGLNCSQAVDGATVFQRPEGSIFFFISESRSRTLAFTLRTPPESPCPRRLPLSANGLSRWAISTSR